jgi:DnaJ family protein C protein 17
LNNPDAAILFQEVKTAYDLLSNEESKTAYDAILHQRNAHKLRFEKLTAEKRKMKEGA